MDANNDNGNGKVTLALLGQKLDALTEIVKAANMEQARIHAEIEKRLICDELAAGNRETRLKAVEEDVDDLKKKSSWGDGINSFLAVVAGLIAWFKT